jgi:hypothetical protein
MCYITTLFNINSQLHETQDKLAAIKHLLTPGTGVPAWPAAAAAAQVHPGHMGVLLTVDVIAHLPFRPPHTSTAAGKHGQHGTRAVIRAAS